MQVIDAKEKHYMREISRFLSSKHSEALGGSEEEAKRSTDLMEIKKVIDGAAYDEPRVMRALGHMVHDGALEKDGFRWVTQPGFNRWKRQLED